jgi:signal transduction histidine kinase
MSGKWQWSLLLVINLSLLGLMTFFAEREKRSYLESRRETASLFVHSLRHLLEQDAKSRELLEKQFQQRLETIGSLFFQRLAEGMVVNEDSLREFAELTGVFRLVFFDPAGQLKASSRGWLGPGLLEEIQEVVRFSTPVKHLGFNVSRWDQNFRFITAMGRRNWGSLVLFAEGEELEAFLKADGYEASLRRLILEPEIRFFYFGQGEEEASLDSQKAIWGPLVAESVILKGLAHYRTQSHLDHPDKRRDSLLMTSEEMLVVFEPVHLEGRLLGVLGLGFSLEVLKDLESNFWGYILLSIVVLMILNTLFYLWLRLGDRHRQQGQVFRHMMETQNEALAILPHDVFSSDPPLNPLPAKAPLFANRLFVQWVEQWGWHEILQTVQDGRRSLTMGDRQWVLSRHCVHPFVLLRLEDVTLEEMTRASRQRERKLFSMGKLVSAFAHEVRNPLNALSLTFQQLDQESLGKENRELLSMVAGEIQRLNQSVQHFVKASGEPQLTMTSVLVQDWLSDLKSLYNAKLAAHQITMNIVAPAEPLTAWFDSDALKNVAINLIENALQAGATQLDLRFQKEGDMMVLGLSDNGSGMSATTRELAFNLFFSTKKEGSGLGLPNVHKVIVAHGGFVDLKSEEGKGTQITCVFPGRTS